MTEEERLFDLASQSVRLEEEPPEASHYDYGDPYYEDVIIGTCANCSGWIFEGNSSTTVHDYCAREFAAYLNREQQRLLGDV